MSREILRIFFTLLTHQNTAFCNVQSVTLVIFSAYYNQLVVKVVPLSQVHIINSCS